MKTQISLIVSAILGILFGILSNHSILVGSWLNLALWGIVGILIGLFVYDVQLVKWSGLTYGFCVTLSFLISGFQGTSDKVFSFAILSLVLSFLGALCGWALVFLGNRLKKK